MSRFPSANTNKESLKLTVRADLEKTCKFTQKNDIKYDGAHWVAKKCLPSTTTEENTS